jgi:ribosomal-protein-serine acetyltransferase
MRPATLRVDDALSLHPREPSDAPEMFALIDRHRGDLREWLTWIDATTSLADVRRYAEFAHTQFESHGAFDYALRADGEIIGAIGLNCLDWVNRSAEIGYWLSPEGRGHGSMTRACAALASAAFVTLDLHRLEIRCVVENTRSRSVAERLCFAFEGVLREAFWLHGNFRDLALYAATSTTWSPHWAKVTQRVRP